MQGKYVQVLHQEMAGMLLLASQAASAAGLLQGQQLAGVDLPGVKLQGVELCCAYQTSANPLTMTPIITSLQRGATCTSEACFISGLSILSRL